MPAKSAPSMDLYCFLSTSPYNLSQRHFDKRNNEDSLKKKGADNSSSTTKEAEETVAILKEGDKNNNILSNPQTVAPKEDDRNRNGEEPFDDTKVSNENKDRGNIGKGGDEDVIETDNDDLGDGGDFDGNDNVNMRSLDNIPNAMQIKQEDTKLIEKNAKSKDTKMITLGIRNLFDGSFPIKEI